MHVHLQFFYFFSEHIRMTASDYHSNLSIILDIFRKKITLQHWFVPHSYNTLANLGQFVIIIKSNVMKYSNHMLSKGEKKNENWLIPNVITRHNAFAMSRDLQSRRASFSPFKHIYYFQFLIFEIIRFAVWFYVLGVIFPRLLIALVFVSQICF